MMQDFSIINASYEKWSVNLGIALSLVGVPLGMYFNQILPVFKWSPIFMFLSVIFVFSFKSLYNKEFYKLNNVFKLVFFFQVLMLLYGLFSPRFTFRLFTFHLYVIFLILALSTLKKQEISFNNLIVTVLFVSGICSILGAFFCWLGLVNTSEAWNLNRKGGFFIESFTVANGSLINLIAAICLKTKKNWIKVLSFVFIGLDIYAIFVSNKRTPIFIGMFSLGVYLYKQGNTNIYMFFRYLKFFLGMLFLITIAYFKFKAIETSLDNFFINFYKGVLNILGNTDVKDAYGSAIMRYKSRLWLYDYISNEFVFLNYILGAGYMIGYIDNPILQSYMDMGIIGILLYTGIVVIYPIFKFFKLKNDLSLFMFLLCIYNILSSYSSGNPYMYIKYVPIILLAFVISLNPNKRNIKI